MFKESFCRSTDSNDNAMYTSPAYKWDADQILVPAFINVASAPPTLRSDDDVCLNDDVANALLSIPAMWRLARIGFLGAIDYVIKGSGREPHRRRHNRREYSIGVAKLAELYAIEIDMEPHARRTIVCAALLHDLGHGPLEAVLGFRPVCSLVKMDQDFISGR